MTNKLSHIGTDNRPIMVDVGDKPNSVRIAKAKGFIKLSKKCIKLISDNNIKKGNVLITAELAGVQAAKKTSDLIPLCHTIIISKADVKALLVEDGVEVESEVKSTGQTGVEMEALTGISVALLTIYDMCKAVDKNMTICGIKLTSKEKKVKLIS